MKWRLELPHHIDEQVLEPGTIIGDDTQWPFRALKADPKIGRKVGDSLPPSTAMTPLDDEARKAFETKFGKDAPERDPLAAIPLTGAPDAPKVRPPGYSPQAQPDQRPVNQAPKESAARTGMMAPQPVDKKVVGAGAEPMSKPTEGPKPTPNHASTAKED